MLAVYKIRFEITPREPTPLDRIAATCLDEIDAWVERSQRKGGQPVVRVQRVDEIDTGSSTPQLRSSMLECGALAYSFFWGRPDSESERRWLTFADLVSDGQRLDFQLQLGIEAAAMALEAGRPSRARPGLIPSLLSRPDWVCRSGGEELSVLPRTLTLSDLEGFCNDALFSAERDLPVVVLTPAVRSGRAPVDPQRLAERLGGTARVVQARDRLTCHVLDQYLGSALAIGPDAIRVFAPGLTPESGVEGHWHFLGETLRGKRLSDFDFSNFLFGRLAERALVRFRESPLLAVFRTLAARERTEKLVAARAELSENRASYEDYARGLESEVNRLGEERRALEEQLERREREADQLRLDLATARANIAELSRGLGRPEVDLAQPPASEPAAESQLRTVAEVVEAAKLNCRHLLILDSANRSARDVPVTYKFTARVGEALEALDKAATTRQALGRIEGGLLHYFAQLAFEYKPAISATTRNTWGDDYRFLYEGQRVMFEEHFTIGVKSANTCISIHFSTSLLEGKIVVAYVGRHLRNTQS